MKVTLNWLKDYVDFNLSADDLSHRLTMTGLEVDAMERLGEGLDSVIVALLDDVRQHPDADRLTICTVETGGVTQQVVCGAQNHKTGDLVALAQVGTVLPGNFKIRKSKIRGQESCGMLCSVSELGWADESDGILILPPGLPLGAPVFQALGLKDVVYEIGLTPNRSDCLSVVGVAREVSAMAGSELRLPRPVVHESACLVADKTSVIVEDAGLCPRYAARLIENVKIGPSPEWLSRRLESVGMRSINNVVDITNFVMMELGQPLHAFDFNLLRGRRIHVRRAQDGDQFTALDGQTRTLMGSDLVICDGVGPVALAGVMGGGNSEVSPETTDILLESAYFNPTAIRRTSKRLGLHTESSHRFERGTDVDMVPLALDRAAALIAELADGAVARGVVDIYPVKLTRRTVTISASRTSQVLGLELNAGEICSKLNSIGLQCEIPARQDKGSVSVEIPNFRLDLEREIDLIEEVARLIGYDHIPVTMPVSTLTCQQLPGHLSLERQVRELMVQVGYAEVINYAFFNPACLDKIRLSEADMRRQHVQILNPLTEEQGSMRTTLVPSLLETAARNQAYRSEDLALFELRHVFQPEDGAELPRESLRLSAVLCGRREPQGWAQSAEKADFFDMKGVVEQLLAHLRIRDVQWQGQQDEPFYHPGKSCALYQGKRLLGTLGELHPEVLHNFDLGQPAVLCDLDVEALIESSVGTVQFQPLSRYPDVQRDSAFLVDAAITAQQALDLLGQVKINDLESLELFDVYCGEGVPAGKKSLAIRACYRAMDRTLTDELIQNLHGKLIKVMEKELGAELR
ncbi:MAG: phenylalanine--tRNA ligase subunit beta [Desulfuromonadales bacterium]